MLELMPSGRDLAGKYQTLRTLEPHAHMVRCLETGLSDDKDLSGTPYVVMEGWKETLAEALGRRTVLDDDEIRNLAIAIARALARYHCEGHVHGQVAADHICLVDGQWKLAPVFGGKDDQANRLTEQTPSDDIFSLGLVLLSCLSRSCASIQGEELTGMVSRATIEQALSELPTFWRHWLGRCLEAVPQHRCLASELALLGTDMPRNAVAVSVNRAGNWYRIQWQPASDCEVRVYQWLRGKLPAKGDVWLLTEIERAAEKVSANAATAADIPIQPGALCQVIIATVVGEAVMIADSLTLGWAADVQRLRLAVDGEVIAATWEWPADAYVAQVAIKRGEFATGRDDPQALVERCFRGGYMADTRFVIPVDEEGGMFHVTVYAIYRRDDGWESACGTTEGARSAVSVSSTARPKLRNEKKLRFARLQFG
jgi:hypothetical protein